MIFAKLVVTFGLLCLFTGIAGMVAMGDEAAQRRLRQVFLVLFALQVSTGIAWIWSV